ncbi:hypothetical protein QVD17_12403 [Tagetes erecta]|uniref:Uncharacterized protein n=1 Tax=Tagetes erecta TaxID=13708 RepID=A0AAD8KZH4_TARER|nr:hypothetical protein QVD17_12403 [Tagetes erecta]
MFNKVDVKSLLFYGSNSFEFTVTIIDPPLSSPSSSRKSPSSSRKSPSSIHLCVHHHRSTFEFTIVVTPHLRAPIPPFLFATIAAPFQLIVSVDNHTFGFMIWGTDEWQKKSTAGKRNRASADSSGKRSRHTGGSVGFDEHRIRLKTKLGREPSFGEVFLETHLIKESKIKLWAGELQINNMEGMNFCTA